METFQDLSLPIPGKEDLAKLHSSIHQNLPAKPQALFSDGPQGWIPFIMDSIRRSAGGQGPGALRARVTQGQGHSGPGTLRDTQGPSGALRVFRLTPSTNMHYHLYCMITIQLIYLYYISYLFILCLLYSIS